MATHTLLKRMTPVALAAFLGYGAACATQSAVSPSTAQQPPSQYQQQGPQGQGPSGYGGQPQAAARAQGFTECFAARTWHASGRAVNSGQLPKTVRIPSGWTPVGGGALGGDGVVILCR